MPEIVIPPTFLLVAGGYSFAIPVDDNNKIYRITGTETITGSNTFAESGSAAEGMTYIYQYEGVATYTAAFVVSFHGTAMSASQALKDHLVVAQYRGAAWVVDFYPDLAENNIIEITKLANLTAAYTIVGNASAVPTAVAISGDVTLSNAGVVAIAAGVIVNADVNASAAIDFSKLAALSSGKILVGSAGNVATAVTPVGDVTITAAGGTVISAAKVTPAMLYGNGAKEAISLAISAESGEQANYAWVAPFAGTIDNIYTYVTKAVAATDDWSITANIGAVAVTNGVVTIAASSTLNTADSATPTAFNAFAAGDLITFVSLKTTVGGKCQLTAHVTRT
jgi:hypothetical protein